MSRSVKITLALVGGVVMLVIVGIAVALYVARGVDQALEQAVAREQVHVAPAPLPTERPMMGREGTDPSGYPLDQPDQGALLRLLMEERYDDLTRYMESYQDDFEADVRKEYWPVHAFDAFASANPKLTPRLSAWREQAPDSYAPLLAQAIHALARGWHARGTDLAGETHAARMSVMHEHHTEAQESAQAALAINPRLMAAWRVLINTSMTMGAGVQQREALLERALDQCPQCYRVRATHMIGLRPRWGGSTQLMTLFARKSASQADQNPRLEWMLAYPDWQACDLLVRAKKFDEALPHCNSALEAGPIPDVFDDLVRIHNARREREAGAQALLRWVELHPLVDRNTMRNRSVWLHNQGYCAQSSEQLLIVARRNPVDKQLAEMIPSRVTCLMHEASFYARKGDAAAVRRRCQLARDLDPQAATDQALCEVAMDPDADDEAVLSQTPRLKRPTNDWHLLYLYTRLDPDHFEAHRDLDYAWARHGQFVEVVRMWDDFIERNPDEGRAWLERSGAYFHMKKPNEVKRDLNKACDLGVKKACDIAYQRGYRKPKKR